MTQTLAEKLLVLYHTSRPLEYTETRGVAALEWSQGILRQLDAEFVTEEELAKKQEEQAAKDAAQNPGGTDPNAEQPFVFSESLDFKTAPKKEKNCKKGTRCGKSCIDADKICRIDPPPEVKKEIIAVTGKLKAKATPKLITSIVTDDNYEVTKSPSGTFTRAKASAQVSYGKESHQIESTVKYSSELITSANGFKNSYSYEFRIDGDTISGKVKNDAMKLTIGKTLSKQFKQIFAEIPEGGIVRNSPEVDDGKGASRARAYEKHGFSKAYTFEVGGQSMKPTQYAIKSQGKLIPWKPPKMPKQVKKFKEAVF